MAQITCNMFSYSIGSPVEIEVVIPSVSSCDRGADKSHELPAKFPVIYLLHGAGNDGRTWLRYTSAERYAEEHRIALVMFSVGNSAYENQPGRGEKYYDFLNEELPRFICNYFPISDRPEDTYLCGYSMGGYGSALHLFTHPEKYAAAGFLSPAILIPNSPQDDENVPRLPSDTFTMVDGLVEKGVKVPPIFICIGGRDFLKEHVIAFHEHLLELGVEHRYDYLEQYEHEYAIWDVELEAFMDWIPRTDMYKDMIPHKI